MKTHTFTAETWLPKPVAEVFPFFAEARNLEQLTPGWLRFNVLTPEPIEMRVGALVDYRLRWHGIPMRWRSEITAWEPTYRFVDEQRRGPYRVWRHEHTFVERDGGTLASDHVEYAAPGGAWINRLFVQRDIKRIFDYRQAQLQALFASPTNP